MADRDAPGPAPDFTVVSRREIQIDRDDLCSECQRKFDLIEARIIYGDGYPCEECKARIIARDRDPSLPKPRAEKLAALAARGFAVEANGRVFCKGCGKDAVWLNSAPAGGTAIAACPGSPPCKRSNSRALVPQ